MLRFDYLTGWRRFLRETTLSATGFVRRLQMRLRKRFAGFEN